MTLCVLQPPFGMCRARVIVVVIFNWRLYTMKKIFTLIAALAMATTLSMPVFAAKKHSKKHSATVSQTHSKKHMKHAKKHGAKKGVKK